MSHGAAGCGMVWCAVAAAGKATCSGGSSCLTLLGCVSLRRRGIPRVATPHAFHFVPPPLPLQCVKYGVTGDGACGQASTLPYRQYCSKVWVGRWVGVKEELRGMKWQRSGWLPPPTASHLWPRSSSWKVCLPGSADSTECSAHAHLVCRSAVRQERSGQLGVQAMHLGAQAGCVRRLLHQLQGPVSALVPANLAWPCAL